MVQTAKSIADWIWRGGGADVDHSPEAQARRGVKSGYERRKRTMERDERICLAFQDGLSVRRIAEAEELSRGAIIHVLKRDIPMIYHNARGQGPDTLPF